MKIEMGESLVASWLKHEYSCQIVETNWKASRLWDTCVQSTEIEYVLKSLKNKFQDLELDFIPKEIRASQLIVQGEIDSLGLSFKKNEADGDQVVIDKIYAVDVAFHENGLNYGGIKETCKRIRKKYIRSALTIYQYFGAKNAEIIFASPKAGLSNLEDLKRSAIDVQNVFNELGLHFDFKLYCNEDFEKVILQPICRHINNISDSSELFVRGLKLLNIFEPLNKKLNNSRAPKGNDELSQTTGLRIGVIAKNIFEEFSIKEALNATDIVDLCNEEYSKRTFGLPYAALMPFNDDENIAFINGYRRYYSSPITFADHTYLLCNHWLGNMEESLKSWSKSIYERR